MSKRLKVLTLINTLQNVPSFVYSNHIEFFTQTKVAFPELDFELFTPHRMSIDNARNTAAQMALRHEADYLLFIDDDVMIPRDTFSRLYKADKDVVAGLVIIRGMPFNVMAFEFLDEKKTALGFFNKIPMVTPCKEGHTKYEAECEDCRNLDDTAIRSGVRNGNLVELAECHAVGFSCCLIKTDILKPLPPPYFVTGPQHTEDVYFCLKLRDLEPIPQIFVLTSVRPGHLLNPEPIEFNTRKKMHDFYFDEWKRGQQQPQRDAAHIQRCLAVLGVKPQEVKIEHKPVPEIVEEPVMPTV